MNRRVGEPAGVLFDATARNDQSEQAARSLRETGREATKRRLTGPPSFDSSPILVCARRPPLDPGLCTSYNSGSTITVDMRGQLAAGAAVALVVCVALVSHISETSYPPRIPTLSTLTRVTRWGDAPETTMLEPVFPVFTVLAGNPDGTMNCSMPATCELSLFSAARFLLLLSRERRP